MNAEVLFLLIHYYSENDLFRFIQDELETLSSKNWKAVVIDNGSKDTVSLQRRLSEHDKIIYVNPGENMGYLNGAARGLDHYKTKYGEVPPLVIVSNTDIELNDSEFLEKILSVKYDFDILGPSVISERSGFNLNPFAIERVKKSKLRFLQKVFSFYPFYLVYQVSSLVKRSLIGRQKGNTYPSAIRTYAIHGSFMVFRKSFFEKGGTLHYPSFLYEEELYIAEQGRLLNMNILFEPAVEIVHYEHSTTGTMKSIFQVSLIRDSLKFIVNTYYNG